MIILTGCASLPRGEKRESLAIMALIAENTSNRTEMFRKFDFRLSDGTLVRFSPKTGYLVFRVSGPGVKITEVRSSLDMDGWNGQETITPLNIALPYELGKISYLPVLFRYQQASSPTDTRSYTSNWNLLPMNVMATGNLKALVAKDPNYKYWAE